MACQADEGDGVADGCISHREIWTRTLLILGMCELCGEDRFIVSLFFPKYFHVATPVGLMWNTGKGGLSNGPIINPSLTSLSNRVCTLRGYVRAD